MAGRILLVVGAVALVAFGVARSDAHDGCDSGRHDAFAIGAGKDPRSGAADVVRRLEEHCRGAEQLVDGTSALLRGGAVEPAARLASTAVAREPERRDAWIALSRAREAQGDAAGARRALDRARQLDPLSFRR
jgi:hypothetical protein